MTDDDDQYDYIICVNCDSRIIKIGTKWEHVDETECIYPDVK